MTLNELDKHIKFLDKIINDLKSKLRATKANITKQ